MRIPFVDGGTLCWGGVQTTQVAQIKGREIERGWFSSKIFVFVQATLMSCLNPMGYFPSDTGMVSDNVFLCFEVSFFLRVSFPLNLLNFGHFQFTPSQSWPHPIKMTSTFTIHKTTTIPSISAAVDFMSNVELGPSRFSNV